MANLAFEQKSVQLSHGRTDYIDAGSGYPVIMLHGSMIYQGGVDWLPCMPQIAAKLRVLEVPIEYRDRIGTTTLVRFPGTLWTFRRLVRPFPRDWRASV